MRIISGLYKSKRISPPKNLPVRPTTDMAKEGIFNVINNEFYFENLTILDLFAGTGNISYEFASRGVKSITSVDNNYNCVKYIKSMAAEMGFDQMTVLKSDVSKYVTATKTTFRMVYADPPYNMEGQTELITAILNGDLIESEGWLIMEHDEYHNFSDIEGFTEQRRYGSVNFSIFVKK